MILQLTKAQSQIAKDTHRFRVVCAGRRFGKSTLASWEMFGKAVAKKDRKIVYVAPTYQQARDIVWAELLKVCQTTILKVNESRLELTIKTADLGQSTIILRGWESIETLRGQKFDFIVIDEVAMMRNFWENWQEVIRPTLTDKRGEVLFISTPKGFNHFYDLYNTIDEDYKSFHFTTYDNPHLPVEEIDKARKEIPEDRFYQEYMADFRKQEGLVYKEFNREFHLFDDFTERRNTILTLQGIDWGYIHPAVLLDIEKTSDDHYWVMNEWSHTGKTDEELILYAGSKKANRVYPDPENPQAIEKAKRAGLNVCEVVKGKGSIDSGVDTVRELLKQKRLHIHKKCLKLISAMEIWSYEDDKYGEEGKDENDALRYPLMMEAPYQYIEDDGLEFSLYSGKFS